MTNKKDKKKHSRDLNKLASSIAKETTEDKQIEEVTPNSKNPHAVALGRLGGLKGGKARANKLTPEERKKIASFAARARWSKPKK